MRITVSPNQNTGIVVIHTYTLFGQKVVYKVVDRAGTMASARRTIGCLSILALRSHIIGY
jgi:hypothetical protein